MSLQLSMLSARRPEVAVANLFRNGEQGVWYDPSDFTTMFQDAAGTTPVTAVGQPVGRILDKSGRGNHATQSTATSRPVLQQDSGGRHYLKFDGVDDFLSTGNINFTGTDKTTVVAGLRKLSDAAIGTAVELGTSSFTTAGAFGLFAQPSGPTIQSNMSGSKGTIITAPIAAAPVSFVSTQRLDIGAAINNENSVRTNGGAYASSTSDAGTGNFGNYPLYIGRRGGTSLPFNGHLYQLVVRGALTPDPAQIERYVNLKTGAY